jgi:hypothetical protein
LQEVFTNLVLTETVDAVDQVESESQSFIQEFSPNVAGVYAFCVDNSRSRLMHKKIEVIYYVDDVLLYWCASVTVITLKYMYDHDDNIITYIFALTLVKLFPIMYIYSST